MGKIITTTDLNSTKFYQLPKAFFHNPLYINMKNESKIAYSILRDLLDLSIKNNWVNEDNEVYVKLSRTKLMAYLNVKGTQKFAQIMQELEYKELLVYKKLGLNSCNEIYICIPDELDCIYDDKELLEKSNPQPVENKGGLKIKPPEVLKSNLQRFENQTHTKTNYTKTNITNLLVIKAAQLFEDNICKLKKTTKEQFIKYCTDYDIDFIMATIELCAEINTESFAGFKTIISGYIDKGIVTKQDLKAYVAEYRLQSKKLRDKERAKREARANKKPEIYNTKSSNFNNFEQRTYDFEDLERKLLGWDKD